MRPNSFTPRRGCNWKKSATDFAITHIHLTTEGKVPGIEEAEFQKAALEAKTGCPVSKALAGVDIQLEARLVT